jgi:hypothetical protein
VTDYEDEQAYADDLAAHNAVEDAKYDYPAQEEPPDGYYDSPPNEVAETVRRAAAKLRLAARAAELCTPERLQNEGLITPAQAHAIANAWDHIADDMGDYGAVEETEGIVNGPSVKDEHGSHRADWGATLGAARALLNAPEGGD